MFCENCGNEIEKGSRFCPVCGHKVDEADAGFKGRKRTGNPARAVHKNIIYGVLGVFAVLLAVFGSIRLFGGGTRIGKTLSEKIFLTPADKLANMSPDEFADLLDEEDALYERNERYIVTSSTDSFMGYDCIYGYGEYDDDIGGVPSGMAWKAPSLYYMIAFDSNDDFKEGQKKIKKYLEKNQVKKTRPLKTKGYYYSGNTYLVECSDKETELFFDKMENMDEFELFGYGNSLVRNYTAEAKKEEDDRIDKSELKKQVNRMDYRMYKFVQVCYPEFDEELEKMFPRDKSYTNRICYIQVTSLPMTRDQYIAFAGTWGYDAISNKEIDLDKFDPDFDPDEFQGNYVALPWQDQSVDKNDEQIDYEDFVSYCQYFMQEHNYNLLSGEYVTDDLEKRFWYLKWFQWDIETGRFADFSEYNGSVETYLAAEENYNCNTLAPFESETEKAVYLAERNYNPETGKWFTSQKEKEDWLFMNYCYNISSGKVVGREVVDALAEYERFLNELKGNMRGVSISGRLVYLDDDDVPECILLDDIQAASRAPADSIMYLLSYQDGLRIEKTIEIAIMGYQCLSGSGLLCVGGDQGSYFDSQFKRTDVYGNYEIIKLTDSFETAGIAVWNRTYAMDDSFMNGNFEINGKQTSEEELNRYIESFGFDPSDFTYDLKSLYESYDNKNLASIIELYQDLESGEKN